MKRLLYQLLNCIVLTAFAFSCTQKDSSPKPQSVSASPEQNVVGYYQYPVPEPMISATAVSDENGSPQIWAVGSSQVTGGHPLYKYSASTQKFSQVKGPNGTGVPGPNIGGVVKIALFQVGIGRGSSNPTELYAVNDQNKLYFSNNGGDTWINTGLLASDVTVGKTFGTYPSSTVFFLGVDNVYGGHRIYQLVVNNQGQYQGIEIIPGSAAVSIAAGSDGYLIVVSSIHEIFGENAAKNGFDRLPGAAINVITGNNTVITGVAFASHGYEIYTNNGPGYVGGSPVWTLQSGKATVLGRSYANYFMFVNDTGEVFLADYQQ